MIASIENVIRYLNRHQEIPIVQRFLLEARVHRAAKLGDVNAQRYMALSTMDVSSATKH